MECRVLGVFAVASFLPCAVWAQNPAVIAGSAEDYRLRAQMRQAAIEHEIAARERLEKWQSTTKLKLPSLAVVPNKPHSQDECLNLANLGEGDTGYIDYFLFEVLEIVGPKEVFLVVDKANVMPICLKGYLTEGFATGQSVVIAGLIEVKGTTTYVNTQGARVTIRNIWFVSPEREAQINDERKVQAELERLAAEEKLYRTWTSADGKYTVDAKFIKFKNGKVHLQNRDGKVVEVSPNKLSKEDRSYYRDLLKYKSLFDK